MHCIVGRVPIAVVDNDLGKIEGRHALQASHVHPELVRVRAAFVVSVNAANRAEMMLRGLRVEPVFRELFLALRDPELRRRRRHRDGAAHPAD